MATCLKQCLDKIQPICKLITEVSQLVPSLHSDMPDRAIVVKVIKAAGTSVKDTVRTSESWARESAIHSLLGCHVCISLPFRPGMS